MNIPRPPLVHRPRRLRTSETLRRMVRETTLSADDFVYPLFVTHGEGVEHPIPSMPGVRHLSVDTLLREGEAAANEGIPAVLLFGIPNAKDATGSEAYADEGIIQKAVRALKRELPQLLVVTDVCLCEYTDHGHCGIVRSDGTVENDSTLDLLARTAVSHAEAGADIVAPSDMMDGRIGAIRAALDTVGLVHTPVMSYAAKYASAFYGPFREAAGSTPAFGDRRSYQMDPANRREALREVRLDVEEGADMIMVKPALPYLDILREVRDTFPELPVAAYNVSGEYAMVKAAAQNGWIEERRSVLELLTGIKRAGADLILTYHAREAARWLREESRV
ncbi:MAG: porphobilinogen synthase [Cytophagales bacterium]|nr:porphobilinogen synthase [Armatimonadota bacterium]